MTVQGFTVVQRQSPGLVAPEPCSLTTSPIILPSILLMHWNSTITGVYFRISNFCLVLPVWLEMSVCLIQSLDLEELWLSACYFYNRPVMTSWKMGATTLIQYNAFLPSRMAGKVNGLISDLVKLGHHFAFLIFHVHENNSIHQLLK